jgi:DNA-binding GntR family transcriptional regulator
LIAKHEFGTERMVALLPQRTGNTKRKRAKGLSDSIKRQILEITQSMSLQAGHHLTTQALAEQFMVSRQPVKEALQALARDGVLVHKKNRGYFLTLSSTEIRHTHLQVKPAHHEQPYFRIAEDRLLGRLPDEVTEAELMRHYQVTRNELQDMLLRMVREGWIEPKPGYGWRFRPVLTSPDSLQMCYRFRRNIEPSALLEPGYSVDVAAFDRLRNQQEQLLDGGIWGAPPDQLFDIGADFHETITACGGNPFYSDSLKRSNRLRRLIEYRVMYDRSRLVGQCQEHLKLLGMLEQGQNQSAAEFLQEHLEKVQVRKGRFLKRSEL